MRTTFLKSAVILCAVAFPLTALPAGAFKRIGANEPVKNVKLVTPDGEPWELKDHLGDKATVVVFWAAWNPRSSELLADLQEIYGKHGPPELQVLAINAENGIWDPATLGKIEETTTRLGLNFPVLVDKNLDAYDMYGVVALPSAVLVDNTGTVTRLLQGYPSTARLEFRDAILETLGVLERPSPASVAAEEASPPPAPPKIRRMVQMAKLLVRKRQPQKAVEILEEAIAEAPDYAEAYRVLAEAHEAADQPEAAAAARDRLAELQNGDAHASAPGSPSAEKAIGAAELPTQAPPTQASHPEAR